MVTQAIYLDDSLRGSHSAMKVFESDLGYVSLGAAGISGNEVRRPLLLITFNMGITIHATGNHYASWKELDDDTEKQNFMTKILMASMTPAIFWRLLARSEQVGFEEGRASLRRDFINLMHV